VGTLGAATSRTDMNGLATTTFTLGTTPGEETVVAQVSPAIVVDVLETAQ
jgi:hypothetical protein